MSSLSIKQTARETGLSTDTLRYYERIGLLAPGRDPSSRHRRYSERDLSWIDFVTKLRSTGMPLTEIHEYIQLYQQGESTSAARRCLLEAQAARVETRIAELQEALTVIHKKIDGYKRRKYA